MEDADVPDSGTVLRNLIDALATPGAVNEHFAAHLTDDLLAALDEIERPRLGSAYNGRFVAIEGEPGPEALPSPPNL